MMKLNTLKPAPGAIKKKKRLGRGQGSGRGGTSTRGHNGAKSRSGYSKKIGFEGGQMPLQRRVPKFGFNSPNRVAYIAVNLYILEKLAGEKGITTFGMGEYMQNGLAANKKVKVKILATGKLSKSLKVSAHAFSKIAQMEIEKTGGEVIKL